MSQIVEYGEYPELKEMTMNDAISLLKETYRAMIAFTFRDEDNFLWVEVPDTIEEIRPDLRNVSIEDRLKIARGDYSDEYIALNFPDSVGLTKYPLAFNTYFYFPDNKLFVQFG